MRGARLESPDAALTALAHRMEAKCEREAGGAANPVVILAMAASATMAAHLDGRVSGSKLACLLQVWQRAWRAMCRGKNRRWPSGGAGIRAMDVDMREECFDVSAMGSRLRPLSSPWLGPR